MFLWSRSGSNEVEMPSSTEVGGGSDGEDFKVSIVIGDDLAAELVSVEIVISFRACL